MKRWNFILTNNSSFSRFSSFNINSRKRTTHNLSEDFKKLLSSFCERANTCLFSKTSNTNDCKLIWKTKCTDNRYTSKTPSWTFLNTRLNAHSNLFNYGTWHNILETISTGQYIVFSKKIQAFYRLLLKFGNTFFVSWLIFKMEEALFRPLSESRLPSATTIHADISGLVRIPSLGGNHFAVRLLEDRIYVLKVFIMNNGFQISTYLNWFKTKVKNRYAFAGVPATSIRADNAGKKHFFKGCCILHTKWNLN